MKRLLGLLLVMGMVGCGQSENAGDAVGHASIGASESSLAKISSEIRRDENGNITFVDLRTSRPLTDAMLVHLTGLNKLEYLTMAHMEVTDAGLIHLKGLTNLKRIWLTETKVAGEGLVHLKGMTQLERLDLSETQVTDAGVAELQQALPNCKIRN